jgi:hypothetical protein
MDDSLNVETLDGPLVYCTWNSFEYVKPVVPNPPQALQVSPPFPQSGSQAPEAWIAVEVSATFAWPSFGRRIPMVSSFSSSCRHSHCVHQCTYTSLPGNGRKLRLFSSKSDFAAAPLLSHCRRLALEVRDGECPEGNQHQAYLQTPIPCFPMEALSPG